MAVSVLRGEKFAIDLSSGEAKPDGVLRVRARVSPDGFPAIFETDGDVAMTDGRLDYAGDFSLRSSDMVATAGLKKPAESLFQRSAGQRQIQGRSGAFRRFRVPHGAGASRQSLCGRWQRLDRLWGKAAF